MIEGSTPGTAILSVSGTGDRRLVKVDSSKVLLKEKTIRLIDNDSIMGPTGNSLAGDGKGKGARNQYHWQREF